MDELDLAIIGLLREEPRAANKKMAQALRVTEATVATRIKSLQARNVIRVIGRRRARPDGERSIMAMVELYLEDVTKLHDVVESLEQFNNVLTVYQTSRRPDLVAYVRADGLIALNATIKSLAARIPHLLQLNTLPLLEVHRFHRWIAHLQLPPPPKPPPQNVGEALIALIEENGRQSVRALARQVGLSETAVRYRLPKLLKETGMEIVLICDSKAMGYHVWADLRLLVAPGALQSAIDHLSSSDDIITLAHVAGSHNLQTMVIAKSVEQLDAFVTERIRAIPGLVDFAILRVPNVLKYSYNYLI